jgi:thiol-disulfide isomerase/thioredoxin
MLSTSDAEEPTVKQHQRGAVRVVVALIATVALAGCSASQEGRTSSERGTTPTAAPDGATPTPEPDPTSTDVPEALDFTATTVDGAVFEGASVAGKPVVLWFWAPWCAVCRGQAPRVTDLAEEYADRVTVIGVGSLDSGDAIAGFADEFPALTHLSDPDGDLWQRFGVAEQSSFVVLDADGKEALRTGYADDDELAGTVADLVGT